MYGRGRGGAGPGSSTSALLQRASAQLRGDSRVHRSYDADEDEEQGLQVMFQELFMPFFSSFVSTVYQQIKYSNYLLNYDKTFGLKPWK